MFSPTEPIVGHDAESRSMFSPAHLSIVLDINPTIWHSSADESFSLSIFLPQLYAFLNAHLAAKHENTLAVFAALPAKSIMLYSSSDSLVDAIVHDANSYAPFKLMNTIVSNRITAELNALADSDKQDEPSALVGALTKALCYINRLSLAVSAAANNKAAEIHLGLSDPRILVISVSPDLTSSYIPFMNSIFSAQKLKVTIDACQLYGSDSVFLQQAAHLTGGSYLCIQQRNALLQYLIMSFLPPPSVRAILAVPTQEKIDFRAVCFCHKNIVDIGFICSVCLSIFCQPVPVCSTCRTKFPIKTLQRLNTSRPFLPQRTTSTAPTSNAPSPGVQPGPGANGALKNGNVYARDGG